MTWHTATVRREALPELLTRIRRSGGTVTGCRPSAGSTCVTWTSQDDADY